MECAHELSMYALQVTVTIHQQDYTVTICVPKPKHITKRCHNNDLMLTIHLTTNLSCGPFSRTTQVSWHHINQHTHHPLLPLSSPLTTLPLIHFLHFLVHNIRLVQVQTFQISFKSQPLPAEFS